MKRGKKLDWKNINFQHLNYFLIAAKHLNFSDAAEELYISYSTLSKAMSRLETQMDIKLFEKDGRNIKLTKYGKIFAGYVSKAITELKNGIDEIERLTNQYSGEVRLSSVFTTSSTYLPERLARYRKEYPEMTVYLTQTSTQEILRTIMDGEIDIGFCGEFNFDDYKDDIDREFIYNDKIVLIVNKSHPLANKKNVSFKDIKDEIFIGYNESAGMNHSIRTAVERVASPDFEFKTLYAMNEESGVIGMVRANQGIAFVSQRNPIDFKDIKVVEVNDLSIVYNIYMVWQRSEYLPSSVTTFKNFIISDNMRYN